MSPVILFVTLALLALPVGFLVATMAGARVLVAPCLIVTATYLWIWLRFRPTCFILRERSIEVVWPLKRREIRRNSISGVRLLDPKKLRQEIGWGMRIGAGGLGGGFGWLWTKRYGLVRMYVSRTDGFVWIQQKNDRPWLITPEHPDLFVRVLSA
ncbi:MAG: hypothetical protein A4E19_11855 [Nitrospira sp. SG-bin1]|nr:MAG: hypothetical protein A4E19_11855 [Nitrospira sp. SG-bin1]